MLLPFITQYLFQTLFPIDFDKILPWTFYIRVNKYYTELTQIKSVLYTQMWT